MRYIVTLLNDTLSDIARSILTFPNFPQPGRLTDNL